MLLCVSALWVSVPLALAQEKEKKASFDIPAGDAVKALKQFSGQSGQQLLYSNEDLAGVSTNEVKGELSVQEALDQLLVSTPLVATRDERTGAVAVGRKSDPNAQRAALTERGRRPRENENARNDNASDSDELVVLPTFVVVSTGVFEPLDKLKASVAISTIDRHAIEKVVPVSAADLLKNVPGVFVNSAHGEIRNIVYSRGVSANASFADNGLYYVSMQEDGLPVTATTGSQYGPDYFLRADATLDRIEAVRGGSAAITSANAPGGIFNYISKRGGDEVSGVISARLGYEADGRSPYRRADINVGGPLGNRWYFNVGGFCRSSFGNRDTAYETNRGGQIKLNLEKRFDNGALLFYGKILNDRNAFSEFIPAVNFADPTPAPGFKNYSSLLPPESRVAIRTGENTFDEYSSSDLSQFRSVSFGIRADFTFGDGWSISNNAKFIRSRSDWNADIALPALPLDHFYPYLLMGAYPFPGLYAGIFGTFTFTDRETGQSAQVTFSPLNSPPNFTAVLNSNLPGQQLAGRLDTTVPALAMGARRLHFHPDEFMEQFSLTKKFDRMAFTAGGYYAHTKLDYRDSGQAYAFGTYEPAPKLLDVSALNLVDGNTYQITDPQGFAHPGLNPDVVDLTWDQPTFFFAHRWEVADKWTFDWGVRREFLHVKGTVDTKSGFAGVPSTTGGIDGNPLTLYDDFYFLRNPSTPVDRKVNTTSYSVALNRELNPENSVYVRYSIGHKAPDFETFKLLNNIDPTVNEATATPAQRVQQLEFGYKLQSSWVSLVVTPFYSKLSNVPTPFPHLDENNIFYSTVVYNEMATYGIEAENEWVVGRGFSVRSALTWQKSELTRWDTLIFGPTRAEDRLSSLYTGNEAANNPEWMARVTPSYRNGRFYGQLQWSYMGSRWASSANAFKFPAFNTTDVTLEWAFTKRLSVALTLNNVFDSKGVMSYQAPGVFTEAVGLRDSFSPEQVAANPDAVFGILTIPPRAYYTTIRYSF